ncbi:GntR family transcriptional regulator [Actinomycetospora termitidis]|uniref:GntR family transcriptional regulator n=1 Tax=Actinomycetospora termitidis TaxID=3053470 RepID=A0ABT7M7D5_9PSEU|nr:GntR family transcriptional regulator [Actinomycetospora sp. Odt1-22]MDL5156104.1 GntR family transcriptional regulator [Actinomycetospora sp. Odt1-22]
MTATRVSSALRCATAVRTMILTGELLPGEKVRQEDLAGRLKMSRIPVREALSTLESEGVIVHRPNTGYTVARFSSEDLDEIYLMRRLLETEVVRTVDLAEVDVAEFEKLNAALTELSIDEQREEFDHANERFHFRLFEYSPMLRVREEIARLWRLSTFYRSVSWNGPGSQARVLAEHDRILEALRARDLGAVLSACDEHRSGTQDLVAGRVSRFRFTA